MKEFLISRQLHIANEESCRTTFWTSRGASNIDLTILNNQAIGLISKWAIHDQESCSDHNIKHGLGNANAIIQPTGNKGEIQMEQRDIVKFQGSLIQIMEQFLSVMNKERGGIKGLDEHLSQSSSSTMHGNSN